MLKFSLFIFAALFLIDASYGQSDCGQLNSILQSITSPYIFMNGCQNTVPMVNFNPTGILGKWYIYQMYNFGSLATNLQCATNNLVANGNTINFSASFLYYNGTRIVGLQDQWDATAFKSAQVTHPGFVLKVLDTDYNSYIIWHNCVTDPQTGKSFERIAVATRSYQSPESCTYDFLAYIRFSSLVNYKVFNNINPVTIYPYGRCNCLSV